MGLKQVVIPHCLPSAFWQYATPAATPIANTTAVTLKDADTGGLSNYVTGLQVYNNHATVSTAVILMDDSTVIWSGYVKAVDGRIEVNFPVPLKGSADKPIKFACITTGSSVFVSAQGYKDMA